MERRFGYCPFGKCFSTEILVFFSHANSNVETFLHPKNGLQEFYNFQKRPSFPSPGVRRFMSNKSCKIFYS